MPDDLLVEPWAERPAHKTDITAAVAKLTDRVVAARVVTEMNREGPMNKFAELAARSASIRKGLEERADKLAKRLDAIPDLADATLGKHERLLDETEDGIHALEESLRDMTGHNSK